MIWLFTSGGQNIGASASVNIQQCWFQAILTLKWKWRFKEVGAEPGLKAGGPGWVLPPSLWPAPQWEVLSDLRPHLFCRTHQPSLTGFHLRLSALLGVKLYLSCLLSVTAPHTPLRCSGSSLMSLSPTPQTVSLSLKTEFPSLVHRPHISQMCKDALSTEKSRVQHHVIFSFLCTNKSQKRQ